MSAARRSNEHAPALRRAPDDDDANDPPPHVLLEQPRGPAEKVVCAVKVYKGVPFWDERLHTLGNDGVWRPTQKGITARRNEVAARAAALQQAQTIIAEHEGAREARRAERGEVSEPDWLRQWHGRQERRGR